MAEYLLNVANISLIHNVTGVQVATATLKSHTISQSVDTNDIRGGQDNKLLTRIKSNKTVTIAIEDVCQNRDMIAIMAGSSIEKKTNFTGKTVAKDYTFVTGGITLTPAPANGVTKIGCWVNGQYVEGTITDSKLTVTDAKTGDVVTVGSYDYIVSSADFIALDSNKFSGSYTLVMDEPVYNLDLDITAYKRSIFPRVTADDAFELGGTGEKSEKTITYNFTAMEEVGGTGLGYFYYEDAQTVQASYVVKEEEAKAKTK